MKRFVVIGLGNFGLSVAEGLYSQGHDVIAVDTDPQAVDQVASHCSRAVVADGRQVETLEEVGAGEADAAVVSIGGDITSSVLSTLALKDLGIEDIYVKVTSREHARVVAQMGAAEAVFPERESAFDLASRISERGVVNSVRVARNLSMQEVRVPQTWLGETLRALEVRSRFGVYVVAVHDTTADKVVSPPDPDEQLVATDTLLLAGADEALEQVAEMASTPAD